MNRIPGLSTLKAGPTINFLKCSLLWCAQSLSHEYFPTGLEYKSANSAKRFNYTYHQIFTTVTAYCRSSNSGYIHWPLEHLHHFIVFLNKYANSNSLWCLQIWNPSLHSCGQNALICLQLTYDLTLLFNTFPSLVFYSGRKLHKRLKWCWGAQ